jgi:hypothetical protein
MGTFCREAFKIIQDNMKYALTITFLLLLNLAKSQPSGNTDSVNIYISRLDWNSIEIATTYVPRIGLNEDAKRLIEIKDKDKIKKLLNKIDIDQKTVAIHMILTYLLEPTKKQFGESYNYGKDSTIKSVIYSYNRLKWTSDTHLQNNSISKEQINTIDRYWRKRCHL